MVRRRHRRRVGCGVAAWTGCVCSSAWLTRAFEGLPVPSQAAAVEDIYRWAGIGVNEGRKWRGFRQGSGYRRGLGCRNWIARNTIDDVRCSNHGNEADGVERREGSRPLLAYMHKLQQEVAVVPAKGE